MPTLTISSLDASRLWSMVAQIIVNYPGSPSNVMALVSAVERKLAERGLSLDDSPNYEYTPLGNALIDLRNWFKLLMQLNGRARQNWGEPICDYQGKPIHQYRIGKDHVEQLKEISRRLEISMPAQEPPDDASAYIPVGKLWRSRDEFKRDSDVTKFLAKQPNEPFPEGIRTKRQGQRRLVHSGDWHKYFIRKDQQQDQMMSEYEARAEKGKASRTRR